MLLSGPVVLLVAGFLFLADLPPLVADADGAVLFGFGAVVLGTVPVVAGGGVWVWPPAGGGGRAVGGGPAGRGGREGGPEGLLGGRGAVLDVGGQVLQGVGGRRLLGGGPHLCGDDGDDLRVAAVDFGLGLVHLVLGVGLLRRGGPEVPGRGLGVARVLFRLLDGFLVFLLRLADALGAMPTMCSARANFGRSAVSWSVVCWIVSSRASISVTTACTRGSSATSAAGALVRAALGATGAGAGVDCPPCAACWAAARSARTVFSVWVRRARAA